MRFSSLLKSNKRPAEGFYLLREHVRFHSKECAGKYGDFISCDDIICLHLGPGPFPSASVLQSFSGRTLVPKSPDLCPKEHPKWTSGRYPNALTTLAVTWWRGAQAPRCLVSHYFRHHLSLLTVVSVTACLGEIHLCLTSFHVFLDQVESLHSQSWSQKSKILFPRLHTWLQPSRCEVKCYDEVFISAKTNEKGVKCMSGYFKTQWLGHDRLTCPYAGFTEIQNAQLKLPSVMFIQVQASLRPPPLKPSLIHAPSFCPPCPITAKSNLFWS